MSYNIALNVAGLMETPPLPQADETLDQIHDDDSVDYTINRRKSLGQVLTYMCSRSCGRSVPNSQIVPSPKQHESPNRTSSVRDVKLKWRREQISSHQDMEVEMSSSWQRNHTQVLWCGFLQKASAAPWRQPQMRWFEVRKEPSVPGSSASPIVMQYQRRDDDDCALPAKRLAISDVRRHAERDNMSGAFLSVAVAGRIGRLQLSAAWERDADELVARITEALRAP